jgi:hypothetical protein
MFFYPKFSYPAAEGDPENPVKIYLKHDRQDRLQRQDKKILDKYFNMPILLNHIF